MIPIMKMMSCKEVHELTASGALSEAGFWKRLGLKLHLSMCRHCRNYVRQIRAIGEGARRLFREGPWDHDALERLETDIVRRAAGHTPQGGPTGDPGA